MEIANSLHNYKDTSFSCSFKITLSVRKHDTLISLEMLTVYPASAIPTRNVSQVSELFQTVATFDQPRKAKPPLLLVRVSWYWWVGRDWLSRNIVFELATNG